jgi:hypothetical protein
MNGTRMSTPPGLVGQSAARTAVETPHLIALRVEAEAAFSHSPSSIPHRPGGRSRPGETHQKSLRACGKTRDHERFFRHRSPGRSHSVSIAPADLIEASPVGGRHAGAAVKVTSRRRLNAALAKTRVDFGMLQ